MAQNPLAATVTVSSTGSSFVQAQPQIGSGRSMHVHAGGHTVMENITSAVTLKTTGAWVGGFSVISPGTSGSWQLFDSPTVSGCATSNAITAAYPFSSTVVSGGSNGDIVQINMPTSAGLTISTTTSGVAVVWWD